jgi:hypothetical protein
MCATGWVALQKVYRRICLRVASAYCTTSTDAIGVITGIAPPGLTRQRKENDARQEKKPGATATNQEHHGSMAE